MANRPCGGEIECANQGLIVSTVKITPTLHLLTRLPNIPPTPSNTVPNTYTTHSSYYQWLSYLQCLPPVGQHPSFASLPRWSSPLPPLVSQTDRSSVSFLSCGVRDWKPKWRWVLSHNHNHRFITVRLSSTIEPNCWSLSLVRCHFLTTTKSWLLYTENI